MALDKITCPSCHQRAEELIVKAHADLEAIIAHHGLSVDIRITSDETLVDQVIHRIDRAAQAAKVARSRWLGGDPK